MPENNLTEPRDIHAIGTQYGLSLNHYKPLSGGHANDTYLLDTQQGKFILTLFNAATVDDVLNLGHLLQWLAQHGFQTTQVYLTSDHAVATMYGDRPVLLKPYINGQIYSELDKTMLHQVGVAMAQLHTVPVPDFLPQQHPFKKLFATVIACPINPDYSAWLASRLAELEERFSADLPHAFIHGDIFNDNVLFDGTSLQAIIDFEAACHHYRLLDIGMAIVGTCTVGTNVMREKASALLGGYQTVSELKSNETILLASFIEYAAVITSCWRFWKYNIIAETAQNAHKYRQMMAIAESVRVLTHSSRRSLPF